jgi:hypothetical protein
MEVPNYGEIFSCDFNKCASIKRGAQAIGSFESVRDVEEVLICL